MSLFGGDDDDGDFLSPSGGAKLASLFGLDQAVAGQGNESFQYTAPKQPKKGPPSTGPSSQKPAAAGAPTVLMATAVLAYRYVNGQYVKQGKLGAAVLGNQASGEYKILLYVSQQKQVTNARISPAFAFTVQANNYCMFYDDQRQNWSVMFESEKAAVEFSKQVCLAKCNSISSLESVLTQDLAPGDGQAVEVGDSLEVAYTGWLYQNHAFGQMFDTNVNKDKLLRLKMGSGKVLKGWEDGMLGMKKGSKRLLIIPPSLGYGSQGVPNRIPSEATLLFEIEVKRVKFAKDSGFDRQSISSRDSVASSPAPSIENLAVETTIPAPLSVPPKPGEHVVRAKSHSLNEQLANPDSTKAKLISRMAKMGQPMPFLTGALSTQPDSSDSELEDPLASRGGGAPLAAPSPAQHAPQPVQSLPPQQPPQVPIAVHPLSSAALIPVSASSQHALASTGQSFQPYAAYGYPQASAIQTVGHMYPAQAPQYQASSDITSFLMTEARQHNTEIRLAIGKTSDKIDQLAVKLEGIQKNVGYSNMLPGISSVSMETSMIMHNIQRIIQENERLKQEVFEKSSRIEELNGKIGDLIQRNQRYVEQSNVLMEQRNDTLKSSSENSQARYLLAEQEKMKVTEELAAATGQVSKLQLELSAHQKKEMELRKQLASALEEAEQHGVRLNTLESQLTELQEVTEHAQTRYKAEKLKCKQLEAKSSAMEEELLDLRVEKENLEKSVAERRRKALAERQRADEETDELRRSYEEELEKLRAALKRARTSTDLAAAEQVGAMQGELEAEWKARSERLLTVAKEQHGQQCRELCEQRDSLQHRFSQLEEKLAGLKQCRDAEEEKLSSLQEQAEELQALKERYSALQSRAAAMKEHYDAEIRSLLQKQHAGEGEGKVSGSPVEEVKRIMNGVFQTLRGEFDLDENYSGRAALGVIMNTIKTVTLQLLSTSQEQPSVQSESEGEAEEEEEETEEVAAHVDTTSPEAAVGEGLESGTVTVKSSPEFTAQPGGSQLQTPEKAIPEESEAALSSIPNGSAVDMAESQGEHAGSLGERTGEGEAEAKQEPAQSVQADDSETVKDYQQAEATESIMVKDVTSLEAPQSETCSVPDRSRAGETREETSSMENLGSGHSSPAIKQPESKKVQHGALPALNGTESELSEGPGLHVRNERSELPSVRDNGSDQEKAASATPSSTANTSLFSDDSGLFQAVTPRIGKPVTSPTEEEEDDDEVSMKGRPPPAPLFGDDDDDDEAFGWLG
ncbi:FK506-binding protein 15 isoform X1 [Callorhinchus milii]|uniref:FK506-binding protein 15 isoform X1 n=1 Tax=Callorhinchus milii TaxID=7868 RepID=UPI001C3FBAC1|nr:FK506-binding protein 15 isoform X1 [Callorhinchus milii]